jgi:hypothetical protein
VSGATDLAAALEDDPLAIRFALVLRLQVVSVEEFCRTTRAKAGELAEPVRADDCATIGAPF